MDNVSTKKTNTVATNVRVLLTELSFQKSKRLLYFSYSFISNHITIDNCY